MVKKKKKIDPVIERAIFEELLDDIYPQASFSSSRQINYKGEPVKYSFLLQDRVFVFPFESFIVVGTLEKSEISEDKALEIHVKDLDTSVFAVEKSYKFLADEEQEISRMVITKQESYVIMFETSRLRNVVSLFRTKDEEDQGSRFPCAHPHRAAL